MITYQLSVQYEDIESTDISNVTTKKRLSHEKKSYTALGKASHETSKEHRRSFCSCWES